MISAGCLRSVLGLRKGALLLARDPYGIKPLYYADDGWTLRFASQVKALLAGRKGFSQSRTGWLGWILSVRQRSRTFYDLSGNPSFAGGLDALGGSCRHSGGKTIFFHRRYVLPR